MVRQLVRQFQVDPGHLELASGRHVRGDRATDRAAQREELVDRLVGLALGAPNGGVDPVELQFGPQQGCFGAGERPGRQQCFPHHPRASADSQTHGAHSDSVRLLGGSANRRHYPTQQAKFMHANILALAARMMVMP